MALTEEHALDPEQQAAVEVEPGTRQVVFAGPGSGKTEVVSALIEHMVDVHDVDPWRGILVISFSNAAIHAADARLQSLGIGTVQAQTMDSLAIEALRDLSADPYEHLDFDGRVARARELLASEGWDRLEELEHLVVDEVQDVVGVRADFLRSIIGSLPVDAGFTLLGDPAQGIYDFQLRTDERGHRPPSPTTSNELITSVSGLDGVETKELLGQYRARSREARNAALLREAVISGGAISTAVEEFWADVVDLGRVEDVVKFLDGWEGTTALLTSTNGDALAVAGSLRDRGVRVRLGRRADQRVAADWIAALLGDAPSDRVARDEFERIAKVRRPGMDADVGWRALRRISGGRGTEVDLTRIASYLRQGRTLPPVLGDAEQARVVVSTVHRAKGLEFDNVVLVGFSRGTGPDADHAADEYIRVLFVALTRARVSIARVSAPEVRRLRLHRHRDAQRSRWYAGGPKPWMTFGFEIGVGDVTPLVEDPEQSQRALDRVVKPGDTASFVLDRERSTLTVPVYTVAHAGLAVGRTSISFGNDLATRIGTLERGRRTWPALSDGTVETVGTVASEPRRGSPWRHGLHLAPVVTGLLALDWNGELND